MPTTTANPKVKATVNVNTVNPGVDLKALAEKFNAARVEPTDNPDEFLATCYSGIQFMVSGTGAFLRYV